MSARLLLYSAPQSCEPSSTLISSVLITRRSSSLTSRPVRTAPTFRFRPASTGSRFVPLKRNAALRDITFRFGNRDRVLIMLSVKPSDKYSAFGSLLSLTNGSIATELIGARDPGPTRRKIIKPAMAIVPTTAAKIRFCLRENVTGSGLLLATVAGSVTVSTCDRAAVGVDDRDSACVTDAVFRTNSILSVV